MGGSFSVNGAHNAAGRDCLLLLAGASRAVRFSVVIRDFDILRLVLLPAKTNSILIVDADTVLAGSISRKLFEP
jgi:hypothetical protein